MMDWQDRTWVYHPDFEAKIVTFAEAEALFEQGWVDTPAKFTEKGETVETGGNDPPDLSDFEKKHLRKYAKDVFGKTFGGRTTRETMLKEINKLHDSSKPN